ncbi:MAG: UDP-N-acetylmuramoyl-L-alanine--D-glutamate ligase [Candidatus Omnitrophica bacterium]|nr:UDP-N-acetylmuramoyl-L-alanine--D-glutamate ligase [Candidatus Omnitrophota bacterium]
MMDLRNKKVVVVGIGTSGIDACLVLHKQGAIVSATDALSRPASAGRLGLLEERFIETEFGGHTEAFLEDVELVVVSPGVPKDSLPVRYALDHYVPVISEMELGSWFCRGPILAITGTNGKSTAVTLLGEIFKKAGRDVIVCGNIGNSLCGEIDTITAKTAVVLEVSSFQLEWVADFSPRVACILNITEDHLERYKDFDDYCRAKFRIFERQTGRDILVLNHDDPTLENVPVAVPGKVFFYSLSAEVEGLFARDRSVYRKEGERVEKLFTMPDCALKGKHNLENVMAVALMAMSQGVDIQTIVEAVRDYKLLKHRVEYIDEIDGVVFIDDSKATNIDAAKRALQAVERPVVLIAGGRDKGGDYRSVSDDIKRKVKKIIVIGEARPKIEDAYRGVVPLDSAVTLQEATLKAFRASRRGDAVLLSPMCSSFDMFRSYKERGDVFQKTVSDIRAEKTGKLKAPHADI